MSVESDIFDALKGLVSSRVYPTRAPANVVTPYIVYQQVGGMPVNFTDLTVPSKKNGRWQVAVWATTQVQASGLGRAIEDTLRVHPTLQTTVLTGLAATDDQATGLFGARQDFSFWF